MAGLSSRHGGNVVFLAAAVCVVLCGSFYAAEIFEAGGRGSVSFPPAGEETAAMLNHSQRSAIRKMHEELATVAESARSAQIDLHTSAYSNSSDAASIRAKVEVFAAVELRLASGWAEAFAIIQASTNQLSPTQVAWLTSQLAAGEFDKVLEDPNPAPASVVSEKAPAEFTPEEEDVLIRGEAIYKELCFACHGDDGKGAPMGGAPPGTTLAPPFAGSKRVLGRPEYVISVVLCGLEGPVDGKNYTALMIPMAFNNNEWIAAVASYVRNDFGNSARMITPQQVATVRAATKDRKEPWTIEELYPEFP